MKSSLLLCQFLVCLAYVANVNGIAHHLVAREVSASKAEEAKKHLVLFDNLVEKFYKIFGTKGGGIIVFVDKLIEGLPNIFEDVYSKKLEEILCPLSNIPDDVDLPVLLGDNVDKKPIFALLVQIAKKMMSEKCEKKDGESSKLPVISDQKSLAEFFGQFNKDVKSSLDEIQTAFEKLIQSLGDQKYIGGVYLLLSKLYTLLDPSVILKEQGDSSKVVNGIISRKDMLDILTDYSRYKCSNGCIDS